MITAKKERFKYESEGGKSEKSYLGVMTFRLPLRNPTLNNATEIPKLRTFFHGPLHFIDGVFRYFELEGVSFEESGDAVDQQSFDLVFSYSWFGGQGFVFQCSGALLSGGIGALDQGNAFGNFIIAVDSINEAESALLKFDSKLNTLKDNRASIRKFSEN